MKSFVRFVALFIVITTAAVVVWQQYCRWQSNRDAAEAALAPQGRLPPGVTPTHYTLALRINPDESRVSGAVQIAVDIDQALDIIWLHGKDIEVRSAALLHGDGTQSALDYQEMGRSGIAQLSSASPISPQQAIISIRFDAPFSKKLDGLYVVREEGRNYAFTQFEPVSARQVFPLFDEPRFKVPFDISLDIRREHSGFGNMPVVNEEELNDGFKRLTLATTPPLPSYLLAFAVGELDVVDYSNIPPNTIRKDSIPLRGISTKGKGPQLEYALKHTAALLNALEAYFGIPYPFAKLDLIAVPDFAAGAMENPGLISYRESAILLNDLPSVTQQRRFANIHAHELAHQWFGNLVTMPWWDDIWLSESFASWMAAKTVGAWNPGLEVERDIVQRGHWVMGEDIYAHSRRLREPVNNNDDIANAFDSISYYKGGAVLQMLESAFTPGVFQQGIRQYLRQHTWGNASAEDLMNALADAADHQPVAAIAESYLGQPGVPLLKLDWRCVDKNLTINIRQQRYLPVGSAVNPDQLWQIPVCLTLVKDDQAARLCHIVDQRQQSIRHLVQECPGAIMPNHDGHGYYRWTLEQDEWRNLLAHLGSLNAGEKLSVANNLAAEYQAARIDTNFYLQALALLVKQPEWDVVTEPARQIQQIFNNIANEAQREQLADYVYHLYQPLLDELGLAPNTRADKDKPVATQLLRERVLQLVALSLRQPQVMTTLADRGKALIGYGSKSGFDGEAIDRQLYATAMASAVLSDGAPYFAELKEVGLSSNKASFREDAIWAMGQTTDPDLIEGMHNLGWVFSLRLNEMLILFESHISQFENKQRTFDWFKTYYPAIELVLPTSYLAETPFLSGELCSREAYADAQAFFGPKVAKVEGMRRNLLQNLEKIQLCYSLAEAQRGSDWTLH